MSGVECGTCGGGGEVYGPEPFDWWYGSGVNTPVSRCPDCGGTGVLDVLPETEVAP